MVVFVFCTNHRIPVLDPLPQELQVVQWSSWQQEVGSEERKLPQTDTGQSPSISGEGSLA